MSVITFITNALSANKCEGFLLTKIPRHRDVNKAGSFKAKAKAKTLKAKAKAKSLKAKAKAKARSLKAKTKAKARDQG